MGLCGSYLIMLMHFPSYSFIDIDLIMAVCTAVFDTSHPLSCYVFLIIICILNKTYVVDPFQQNFDVLLIFYYRYFSTYCDSLFLVCCFSNILYVCDHSLVN